MGGVEILIAAAASIGALAGGTSAFQNWRDARAEKESKQAEQNSNTALDALTLAIETYVRDNGRLRDRVTRVETELESCEQSKRTQGERIGSLEAQVRILEANRG